MPRYKFALEFTRASLLTRSWLALLALSLALASGTSLGWDIAPQALIVKSHADLAPLRHLRTVELEGDLVIEGASLETLHGLEAVSYIEGDLIIRHNKVLRDISQLTGLSDVNGSIIIEHNPNLTHIPALPSLKRLGGINISANERLGTIMLSAGITPHLEQDLRIEDNPHLTQLNGLSGIRSIGGDLRITGNPRLEFIDDFPALESIAGTLAIKGNTVLPHLSLDRLTRVGGEFELIGNERLIKASFKHLESTGLLIGTASFIVKDNPMLNTLELAELTQIGGPLQTSNILIDANPRLPHERIRHITGKGHAQDAPSLDTSQY